MHSYDWSGRSSMGPATRRILPTGCRAVVLCALVLSIGVTVGHLPQARAYSVSVEGDDVDLVFNSLRLPADASDIGNDIDVARREVAHMRELLRRIAQAKTGTSVEVGVDGEVQYEAPTPPAFIEEERNKQREREAVDQQQVQAAAAAAAETAAQSGGATGKSRGQPCSVHRSCNECVSSGCGWCIGGRRCIEDIPWICRGDHDHVGLGGVGKHTVCPSEEDNRRAHEKRSKLRMEARQAASITAPQQEQEQEQSSKVSEGRAATLPAGTYSGSCTGCELRDDGRVLFCAQCLTPDQQAVSAEIELSSCTEDQEIGNDSGRLTCVDLPITKAEAKKRAKQRLHQRELEELERIRKEIGEEDGGDDAGSSKGESKRRSKRLSEEDKKRRDTLERYVEAAASGQGGSEAPYETLGLDRTATQGQIRRAYRRLTLQLHPDKNDAALRESAETAFRSLVAAYEILSDPDKRAAFDDFGGHNDDEGGFESYWEYQQSGQKDERNFYNHNRLITQLTETLWDRRLIGDSIWLVEFYAPWCSHCQSLIGVWKAVAVELEKRGSFVEVGAVNCETQKNICGEWFDVPAYPTIMVLNNKWGTQQIYQKHQAKAVEPLVEWATSVATEWQYLFSRSNIQMLKPDNFSSAIVNSSELWIVCFLDGLDCSSCKTAVTNALRLSAGLRGMALVGLMDCAENDASRELCYKNQSLPEAPHPAIMKMWPRRNRSSLADGVQLYNPNEIEPHVALQIVDRTVRAALYDELDVEDALSAHRRQGFDSGPDEEDKEDFPPPPPPPPPMWNGPQRPAPLPWDGSGGGGGRRRQIDGRL